jgi:hypothetical protein
MLAGGRGYSSHLVSAKYQLNQSSRSTVSAPLVAPEWLDGQAEEWLRCGRTADYRLRPACAVVSALCFAQAPAFALTSSISVSLASQAILRTSTSALAGPEGTALRFQWASGCVTTRPERQTGRRREEQFLAGSGPSAFGGRKGESCLLVPEGVVEGGILVAVVADLQPEPDHLIVVEDRPLAIACLGRPREPLRQADPTNCPGTSP